MKTPTHISMSLAVQHRCRHWKRLRYSYSQTTTF